MKFSESYKSIGEVAKLLNLFDNKSGKYKTHVIRYWEKEFKQIKPKLFGGNRRYYDKSTILILKKIKYLLKDKGMTINGVKKQLKLELTLDLDENANRSINSKIIKEKLLSISKRLKKLK